MHGGIHAAKTIGQSPILMSQQDDEVLDDNDQAQHLAVTPNAVGQREGQIGHLWSIQVTINVVQRPHRQHHGLFVLENKDMAWRMGNGRDNA